MFEGEDALDELIREGAKTNPDFPALVDAAAQRRKLLRSFGRLRESLGLTQQAVATRMNTSQAHVATLESGATDPKLSTLERYATSLGLALHVQLTDQPAPSCPPQTMHPHDPIARRSPLLRQQDTVR